MSQKVAKRPSKWIVPDFDTEIPAKSSKTNDSAKQPEEKRQDPVQTKIKRSKVVVNWMLKLTPKLVDDLAVSKKKVEEVEGWIKWALKPGKKTASILLLSGPTGAGKTATVSVICRNLGIKVSEWITPTDVEYAVENGDFNYTLRPKQVDLFKDFLLQARYPSLWSQLSEQDQITLVEDYPNSFIRDPTEFHNVLQQYVEECTSPIIFICTDCRERGLNISKTLFPDKVRAMHQILNISFNSVSMTGMQKALKNAQSIMSKENEVYKIISQDCIDSIANSSTGDIRNAIINLHFSSLKDSSSIPLTASTEVTKSKRSKNKNMKLTSLGCDESLNLMHGLGRVLYPKRSEAKQWKFVHDPDLITDNFLSMPSSFISFLHENYLKHYSNIEEAYNAVDCLCRSDLLLNDYKEKDISHRYAMNVAIRGVMASNTSPTTGRFLIQGPKFVKVKEVSEFQHFLHPKFCPKADLVLDYAPYCKLISPT